MAIRDTLQGATDPDSVALAALIDAHIHRAGEWPKQRTVFNIPITDETEPLLESLAQTLECLSDPCGYPDDLLFRCRPFARVARELREAMNQ